MASLFCRRLTPLSLLFLESPISNNYLCIWSSARSESCLGGEPATKRCVVKCKAGEIIIILWISHSSVVIILCLCAHLVLFFHPAFFFSAWNSRSLVLLQGSSRYYVAVVPTPSICVVVQWHSYLTWFLIILFVIVSDWKSHKKHQCKALSISRGEGVQSAAGI